VCLPPLLAHSVIPEIEAIATVARRELLAQAANRLLDGLRDGPAPELPAAPSVLEQPVAAIPGSVAGEDEERLLHEVNARVVQEGPAGGRGPARAGRRGDRRAADSSSAEAEPMPRTSLGDQQELPHPQRPAARAGKLVSRVALHQPVA
jgi:hypothetical protein